MKKLFLAFWLIALTGTSALAIEGIGYDVGLNQIKLRIPISSIKIEPGVGFLYDEDQDEFGLGISAMVLYPAWEFQKLTAHLMGGINIQEPFDPANPDDDIIVSFFGGLQPEVEIWEHLLISTRFGLDLPMTPDLKFGTFGNGFLDVVDAGLSFTILFGGSGSSSSGSTYTPPASSPYSADSDSEY